MPVSLLRISRLKCSEQFLELKMAERNTISEPAVDTRSMRQMGNVSQPTDPSDTEHYFFSLSSFVFPNFLSYFLFLPRWCVSVYLSLPLFIHPSPFRISFFLLVCFLSLILTLPMPLATTLFSFHLSPSPPSPSILPYIYEARCLSQAAPNVPCG